MAFHLSWALEGRVLYALVYGTLTDGDDAAFDGCVRDHLDASPTPPVHLIIDYTGLESIQTHIVPAYADSAIRSVCTHPALGLRLAVVSAANPMLRYLSPLTSFALKPCENTFDLLSSALAYLCRVDRTLPRVLPLPGPTWPRPA